MNPTENGSPYAFWIHPDTLERQRRRPLHHRAASLTGVLIAWVLMLTFLLATVAIALLAIRLIVDIAA